MKSNAYTQFVPIVMKIVVQTDSQVKDQLTGHLVQHFHQLQRQCPRRGKHTPK